MSGRLGFIGAGHIGSQLARLAVANGYDVVLSNSRGPETLTGLVKDLGPRARAGTTVDAAHRPGRGIVGRWRSPVTTSTRRPL